MLAVVDRRMADAQSARLMMPQRSQTDRPHPCGKDHQAGTTVTVKRGMGPKRYSGPERWGEGTTMSAGNQKKKTGRIASMSGWRLRGSGMVRSRRGLGVRASSYRDIKATIVSRANVLKSPGFITYIRRMGCGANGRALK